MGEDRTGIYDHTNEKDWVINAEGKGEVVASIDSTSFYDGSTALTPKYTAINKAGSGDNEIVAAVATKKIRVLQITIVVGAAVNVRFESSAGGTALTGIMEFAANSGMNAGYCPLGHFETVAGENLNMELSGEVNVDGWLVYVEV